jgi:hypothetical protein
MKLANAQLADCARLVPMVLSALLLGACGGGGGGNEAAVAMSPDDATSQLQAETTAPAASPYTLQTITSPVGGPVLLGLPDFPPAPGSRIINSKGQFIGEYANAPSARRHALFYNGSGSSTQPIGDPDAEFASLAQSLNESGLVAGTTSFDQGNGNITRAAFAWSASTGKLDIVGLTPNSSGSFTSDPGLVGGAQCPNTNCNAFWWESGTSSVRKFSDFQPLAMNNAGTMAGFITPNTAPHLDTLTPDGTLTVIQLDDTPDTKDHFIADDGTVFFNALHDIAQGGFKQGAIAVVNGTPANIGRGLAVLPPGSTQTGGETASFTSYSLSGHAVGLDQFQYFDGCDTKLAFAAFLWSAAEGTTRIEVGTLRPIPTAVNKDGVVVGHTAEDDKPFVWTRSSGGVALETLIANPPAFRLGHAVAVSDGGHILVESEQGIVLLAPSSP